MNKKHNNKSAFIVLEGGEGSGKSTQLKLLTDFLRGQKIDFVETREPGGTDFADKIRDILLNYSKEYNLSVLAELFLFCVARVDHIEKVVKPALEAGKVVICDRFDFSTFAYQVYAPSKGTGKFKELEKRFEALNKLAKQTIDPDLTIFFNIDPAVGIKRRGDDLSDIDKRSLDFHNKVREGYLYLAENNLKTCEIVDASGSIEKVQEQVQKVLKKRFGF